MEFTDKQSTIVEILEINGIDYPTKNVIEEYSEMVEGRDEVSKRHVQRIRKWCRENNIIHERKEKMDLTNIGLPYKEEIVSLWNQGYALRDVVDATNMGLEVVIGVLKEVDDLLYQFDEDYERGIYNAIEKEEDVFDTADEDPGSCGGSKTEVTGSDDFWEVEIPIVAACSRVKDGFPVLVSPKAKHKVMRWMQWSGSREWLAYLVGKMDEKKAYVSDVVLPAQDASSTLVNNVILPEYADLGIIGVIHSHHEMGAGKDKANFSGHDENFINGNHNISLLIGKEKKTWKILGHVRLKTPCDHFVRTDAKVIYENGFENLDSELKKEFEEKIHNGNRGRYYDDDQESYYNGRDSKGWHFGNRPNIVGR